MDSMPFGRKTLNTPRPRADRFVVPRDAFPEIRRRLLRRPQSPSHFGVVWCTKNVQQKKYTNYLDEAFGLDPLYAPRSKSLWPPKYVQPWPCIPREKSYLSSADSILDLPTYSYAAFPDLLDWSTNNILVAALGRNYHKWSWQSQGLIGQGYTQTEILCCKFDPRGELLALGTTMQSVEIHDNALSKKMSKNNCQCIEIDRQPCSITAIDWSPSGNSFVIGCSRGTLSSITRDSKLIRWQQVLQGAILVVRISPDARYVAAAGVNIEEVHIMYWPHLKQYYCFGTDWTIKTLTWHPWRSALLGVGAISPSLRPHITMWDAPTRSARETIYDSGPHSLDAMLFSHRTGELVLSIWNLASFPRATSQLVVLSDPETVVDQWGEGRSSLDRVRTMVFSPDGTKLATATADEDLIIWNFLPGDKNKKNHSGKFSLLPQYLDKISYGTSLR